MIKIRIDLTEKKIIVLDEIKIDDIYKKNGSFFFNIFFKSQLIEEKRTSVGHGSSISTLYFKNKINKELYFRKLVDKMYKYNLENQKDPIEIVFCDFLLS